MKALFEKIIVPEDASWVLLHRQLPEGIPFEWHYHPEFELTLTLNSRGQRYVGDHIGDYDDGDLVLLGPNVPHTWESREKIDAAAPHEALVMWLVPGWISALTQTLPELKQVEQLLLSAARGLAFSQETAEAIRPLATSLPALGKMERLPVLLSILTRLAHDPAPEPLASPGASSAMAASGPSSSDQNRLEEVLNFIHANYAQPLSVTRLAEIACLSASALSRLFKRTTGSTVTEYIARLRIGRACAMLIDDDFSIAHIASAAGYRNLSNFNRQFLAIKGVPPSAFRRVYRQKSGQS